MTSWDDAEEKAEKAGGGLFVSLKNDKDSVVGAFVGEPYVREVIWTGSKYETFNPDEHEGNPSLRVMLNFYVPAEESMKVIEGGATWFKSVCEVRKKYGLDKWTFEVTRHGAKGDPKTKYSILPEEKIDDKLAATIESELKNDLQKLTEPKDDLPF